MPQNDNYSKKKSKNLTIDEAKNFLQAADIERENWAKCAKRSWNEIKKLQQNGVLWSVMPNSAKKRVRYPLWYSTWKIRRPIVYARCPEPIGIDKLEGKDPIGETGAILKERLSLNLMEFSGFHDSMCGVRDDVLATQLGAARAYCESEDAVEERRERLQIVADPELGEIYVHEDGSPVLEDELVLQDEQGPYIQTEELVGIINEKICSKHIIYSDILIDPGAFRWSDVQELAFGIDYTVEEFKRVFGEDQYGELAMPDQRGRKKKNALIRVWEYWNKRKRQMAYLTPTSDKFLTKLEGVSTYGDDEADQEPLQTKNGAYNDPYKLAEFFPCAKPMVMDQPTDSFWPISEWYIYNDLIEEIHYIFSNIYVLSRAIRVRALFDNSIPGLQSLANEAGTADWIGIDNLKATLDKAGGSIANVVAWIPVEQMIQGLREYTEQFEQRLEKFGQLTGTTDLMQGKGDQVERTYGEQQMRAKFSLNQLEPYQSDIQRFARDHIELMCEMALKNFTDESLAQYIVPETLTQEHQANYAKALELIKNDRKGRFRVEIETDSTIALDEQYDMQMRKVCGDTLMNLLQTTANVIETSPILAPPLIEITRNVAMSFRQGKLFAQSIDASLEQTLQKAEALAAQPPPPPPFDKDKANAEIEVQRLTLEAQQIQATNELKVIEITSRERIEGAKIAQESSMQILSAQMEQFKAQLEQGQKFADLQLGYQELEAKIMEAQGKLALEREALLVELRKIADSKEMKDLEVLVGDRFKPYELQLQAQAQQLDQYELMLREREQAMELQKTQMDDLNTQIDNARQEMRLKLDAQSLAHEMSKPPEMAPMTFNLHLPEKPKTKKLLKVTRRNAEGDAEEYKEEEITEPDSE